MNEGNATELAMLIAHLLEGSQNQTEFQNLLSRLAPSSTDQVQLLTQVRNWVECAEDPTWLETMAAYREGVPLPEMEDWLAIRSALTEASPATVLPFDLLSTTKLDEEPFLADSPTFIDVWQQEHQTTTPAWVRTVNAEWQHWQEKGCLLIRQLQDTLSAPPLLTPVAVKGHASDPGAASAQLLQRITLNQDEVADCDLEALFWRATEPPHECTVVVSVQIPSRWPDLAGVPVKLSAGTWQTEGQTNADGEVTFTAIPEAIIPMLMIEVQTNY